MQIHIFHTKDSSGHEITKAFSDKKAVRTFLETCYRIRVGRLNEIGIQPPESLDEFINHSFHSDSVATADVITESESAKEAEALMRNYI